MTTSSNPVEEFSGDDRERLARCDAWKQDPGFVESMCRLLHEVDPMGCWSGENPHAMTEYLLEVEMIAKQLGDIESAVELSAAMKGVFDEMFESHPANCDLDELAEAAWPIAAASRTRRPIH